MNLEIRPTDMPNDAVELSRIQAEFDPEVVTPESLIEKAANVPQDWTVLRATALMDGEIVGFYNVRRTATMKPNVFIATIAVAESHRGKGYGSEILSRAEAHLATLGPAKPHAIVREDVPGATDFFAKRGYSVRFTLGESTGNLAAWRPAPADMPQGYHIFTWDESTDTPENRRRLYTLLCECDRDEPGTKVLGLFDFVSFDRDAFEPGVWRPDWCWVAVKGDEWVGYHQIKRFSQDPADANKANISYTGVAPSHRTKGIATALKAHGLNRLVADGIKTVLTHNDTTNGPMLRVNDKVGIFTTEPGWAFMGKELGQ